VWGKNDTIFPEEGAHPYKHDLNNIEFHLLDTGHFALEEDGDKISYLITCFMAKHTDFLDTHPEYEEICQLAA
jgi:pimeloyl-ACP methyl ester carboxylesterase